MWWRGRAAMLATPLRSRQHESSVAPLGPALPCHRGVTGPVTPHGMA